LYLGITLLVLAIAISLVLWQEKNQRAISAMADDHQQIIVNSVKMKEELASMQLRLVQALSTTTNSRQAVMDMYGGEYNPTVVRYSLRSLLDSTRELQAKTGFLSPVTEKLGSQLSNLFAYGFEIDPEASDAGDRKRIQLQSLLLSAEQLERLHSLEYQRLARNLDSTIRRDNRNLVIFMLLLALMAYLMIRWAQGLIDLSLKRQHLSERKLLRSQRELNNLLKALPDSVMRLSADGRILESRGRQTILNSVGKDIVGKSLDEIPLPETVKQGLSNAIATELETARISVYEFDLPNQDESYEARIIKHGEDEVICIVRDVTAQEIVRRQQEVLTEELEAKNAELERFVYTVSHDLKSPLVTITGYIGMLQQAIESNDSDRITNDMQQISTAAESMAELLEGLLELSRIGRIVNPPEAGSLSYLVRNAVDSVREKVVSRGIELEIYDDMPQYWGDRLRLLEVFQNLLENAIKFMGDQPSPRIRISALEIGDDIVCRVEDNGIGIDPRYHDRIFNLFERLDTETDGTGIGLSLVQRIIEAHGGTVRVESAGAQQGCTIEFTLPKRPG
jgi:signal transduction histidine kinase